MSIPFARLPLGLMLTVALLASTTPAGAQELVPPLPTASREVVSPHVAIEGMCLCDCPAACSGRVVPYGWIPAMHGDVTIRGETAAVDVSIGDVLDILFGDLDIAALGQVEAHYGKCGVIFNGFYVKVSPGGQFRNLNFSTDFEQTILDLTLTYELECVAEMLCLPPCSRFEVLAGARYNALEAGLTITGPRGNSVTVDGTEEWLDPIIGARLRVPLCECATAQVRGDIGGFDLGDASKFTWNIEALVEYRCSERCSLFGGWRWLDIDYEKGSGNQKFAYDVLLSGPLLGIAIDF